jgi:hypothetical protein
MKSPDYTVLIGTHHLIFDANTTSDLQFAAEDHQHWPNWYLNLLSQLHAVLRGRDIEHLSSSVTSDPSPQGEVVVFTRDLVIRARVIASSEGTVVSTAETTVWRRSDIADIALLDVDVFPELVYPRARSWPRRVALTLTYRDQPDLSLPLTRFPSDETMSSLIELIDGLFSDLTG